MTASEERLSRADAVWSLSGVARLITSLLLVIAVLRFWIMPLGSSFFCDEAGSYWSIKDGLGAMWSRFAEFPSTPPAYAVILWFATVVGGAHEYVMRIPSVLAMAAACFVLYRLAAHLFGRDAALPSCAAFLCSKTIIFASTDARPYAFLLLFIISSTLALVRWLESGHAQHAMWFVVTAALIPYYHYLATPILVVYLFYAWIRIREGTPVRLRSLVLAGGAMIVLMLPMVPPLLTLIAARHTHVYTPTPTVRDLAFFLTPPVLLFCMTFGLLLAWLACPKLTLAAATFRRSTLLLAFALTLGPAMMAFSISLASPTKFFVDRYLVGSLVGLSLVTGWAISYVQPLAARLIIVNTIVLVSLAAFGYPKFLWPPHRGDDWRGALAAVRQTAGPSPTLTVLMKSPFVEYTGLVMSRKGPLPGWVLAPLALYPESGKVVPVSYIFDETSSSLLEAGVVPAIRHDGRFIMVSGSPDEVFTAWLNRTFPDYSQKPLGSFGGVEATLFELPERHPL